jgi:hypothetical protein
LAAASSASACAVQAALRSFDSSSAFLAFSFAAAAASPAFSVAACQRFSLRVNVFCETVAPIPLFALAGLLSPTYLCRQAEEAAMRNIQKVLIRVSLVFTFIVAAALPVPAQQEAISVVPADKDVYAVKFLCGSLRPPLTPTDGVEWPVKPGNYLTAINVHNPNTFLVGFRKKAVLLYRFGTVMDPEAPMPPGEYRFAQLKPDWGLEIDCLDIRKVLLAGQQVPAPTFIKGWVILEVFPMAGTLAIPPIDVTAVYTSHGWRQSGTSWVYDGFAEDVEAVLPKRVK